MKPTRPTLAAIVAMTQDRVIGRAGKLPWHYPEDLRFFKQTTTGHTLLMGRKTYESIGKPLPNRRNIVLSRTMQPLPGVEVIRSFADLWQLPGMDDSSKTVFLIGGAELFAQLLPECDLIYLTRVLTEHEGDVVLMPFEHLFDEGTLLSRSEALEFWKHLRLVC